MRSGCSLGSRLVNRLGRQVHHDVASRGEVAVSLRGQALPNPLQVLPLLRHQAAPTVGILLGQRIHEPGDGELGIDDDVPTTREMDHRVGPEVTLAHLTAEVPSLDQATMFEDPLHPDLGPSTAGPIVGEQGGDALHLAADPPYLLVEGGFTSCDRFLKDDKPGVDLGHVGAQCSFPAGEGDLKLLEARRKFRADTLRMRTPPAGYQEQDHEADYGY